jgi:hypothetical protein
MAKFDFDKIIDIVYNNEFNQDQDRQYPPFKQSMRNVSVLASNILRKDITPYDVAMIMVCLKLDRDGHKKKKDNLFDALSYLGIAFKICEDDDELGYNEIEEQ